MRVILLPLLLASCAAPATELKACPSGDCEAEARAQAQADASRRHAERLRSPRLLSRASFDLDCPAADLVVVELSWQTRGVRGCGRQASYVRMRESFDEWVLNSPTR